MPAREVAAGQARQGRLRHRATAANQVWQLDFSDFFAEQDLHGRESCGPRSGVLAGANSAVAESRCRLQFAGYDALPERGPLGRGEPERLPVGVLRVPDGEGTVG